MFTINISFKEALECYEQLIKYKMPGNNEYHVLEKEFSMFARRRAEYGDEDAQNWLDTNSPGFSEDPKSYEEDETLELFEDNDAEDSPLSFFTGERSNHDGSQRTSYSSSSGKSVIPKIPESKDVFKKMESLTDKKIEEILAPLGKMKGLEDVKKEIYDLAVFAQAQKKRSDLGMKLLKPQAMHMVFTGNPGCGKTTTARLLGDVMNKLGLLSKSRVNEVDRTDLVGEYIGETAQKTMRELRKARGGILFIDEAYALFQSDFGKDFGKESIDTLVKYMEDHLNETVIIVAGYTKPMQVFLESNPGLHSRFPIHIDFPDYAAGELVGIFQSFCADNDLMLEMDAAETLYQHFEKQKKKDGDKFANGRTVRNFFEKTLRRQAQRIMSENIDDPKELKKITSKDLQIESKKAFSGHSKVSHLHSIPISSDEY